MKTAHGYVVIRIDHYLGDISIEDKVSVVGVLPTKPAADREAERLNHLNPCGSVAYFVKPTKIAKSLRGDNFSGSRNSLVN